MAERSGAHVSADASLADDVTLGPGAVVHAGVTIGAGSAVGAGAVLHPGTTLGERCLVEDNAVLGKRPRLRPGSSARGDIGDLVVADDVTICAGAVVYAGARIGAGSIIGDQAHVRERSVIGARRGDRARLDGRLRRARRRPRLDPDARLPDRAVGRRGRRLHRPRGDDHQRRHDGPPSARRRGWPARSCAAPAGSAAAPC